jgi:hypothetical protein
VQLRNATGAALPFDIQNHGGLMVTAAAPKKVNVAPGSTAYFLTDQFRCDISDADHVTSAVVGLSTDAPIGTVSLSQGGSDFALCGTSDPPNEVHVSPFVSVVSDALS